LGRLPIIGNAFKQKNEDSETTELVVFITPHIVSGDALVTGQEARLGGSMKSYRSYGPSSNAELPPEGAPPQAEAAP
jgi:type II secretory pathway component GspD/PulD (secretin)